MNVDCYLAQYDDMNMKMEPWWATKVRRWYQLDRAAFSLVDLCLSNPPQFDNLILASLFASNPTDRDFFESGLESTHKFVHTLPNIRAAAVLEALDQSTPLFCLDGGLESLLLGLEEFYFNSRAGHHPLLLSTRPLPSDQSPQKWTSTQALLISLNPQGSWVLKRDEVKSDLNWPPQDFQEKMEWTLGNFRLEKNIVQ